MFSADLEDMIHQFGIVRFGRAYLEIVVDEREEGPPFLFCFELLLETPVNEFADVPVVMSIGIHCTTPLRLLT